MAISVNTLLETVGLKTTLLKTVKWGQQIESSSIGIYVVSTCKDSNSKKIIYDKAPIDENILRDWINKVPAIQVDGRPATVRNLKERLNSFWLPDENIIYIGQTESSKGLRGRISQYYRTDLRERKPHTGGHWIKTLKVLNELYVHYIPSPRAEDVEKIIMKAFVTQVSKKTKEMLFDMTLTIPFANLVLEQGNRKRHGITKSTLKK